MLQQLRQHKQQQQKKLHVEHNHNNIANNKSNEETSATQPTNIANTEIASNEQHQSKLQVSNGITKIVAFVPIDEIQEKEQNQKQQQQIANKIKTTLQQQSSPIIIINNKKQQTVNKKTFNKNLDMMMKNSSNSSSNSTKTTKIVPEQLEIEAVEYNSNNKNKKKNNAMLKFNNNHIKNKQNNKSNSNNNININNNSHQEQNDMNKLLNIIENAKPNDKKKTKDFNSRRRRGRLRCLCLMENENDDDIDVNEDDDEDERISQIETNNQNQNEEQQHHQKQNNNKKKFIKILKNYKNNHHQQLKNNNKNNYEQKENQNNKNNIMMEEDIIFMIANENASNCYYNSIVPAICNKIRLATFDKLKNLKVALHNHVVLLLSLLLTFIDDYYVNSIKFLVLSLKLKLYVCSYFFNSNFNFAKFNSSSYSAAYPKNMYSDNAATIINTTTSTTTIAAAKPITNNMSIKSHENKHQQQQYKQNKQQLQQNSQQYFTRFRYCNNVKLIYALLICLTVLQLPNVQNFADAAKPKSATQLQKQQPIQQQNQQPEELEQQQQQQHHHHNNNNKHHEHQAQQPHLVSAAGVSFDSQGKGILTPPSYQVVSSQTSNEDAEFLFPSEDEFDEDRLEEHLSNLNDPVADRDSSHELPYDNATLFDNTTKTPLFPKDLFTKEQLENGAVVFHILGVIYMFVALAIVCDEFFVPSLDVIIEKLGITDDVAGATFMAAGGSAPELFTSVIGVFVSFDDVGIGTIVGSAVFNILFVIGMCALFSKTVLTLTWWPLFRDCSFYSVSLIVLIYFFRDNRIHWWEALILFFIYIAYVAFMKWNVQVERCVKKVITKNKVTRVRSTDQLMPAGNAANSSETSMATQPGGSVTSRAASETRSGPTGSSSGAGATGNSSGTAGSTQTGAKFRHGLLQLMIHTIDPLHDGKVDEKATQLHAIASLKVLLDATKPQRGGATTSAANHVKINLKETTLADRPNGNIDTTLDSANEIEDEPEPLSMAWPDTARKRLTYILVAPLLIPMWLTLPDTRTPRGKKYFPVTFIGSILWIAAFSYLMVWWANVAGDTARIPPEVMGLTFLAAGTSIPDLITSVIVARKGFGDMAVSSSVGSNIFDVTVGLPIPWLLYGLIYSAPVEVNSVGMVCSITILFMMLLFVVLSIACFRWRMNKGLGFTMFLLYFAFVAVSLMFEYKIITCPV